ncbi:MAG: hypothetical protein COA43_10905 [Robiginitomaculum sp.]|nr:MAG: hypothetical protein COA43_10905 [Robiginitomaculum sp.]
MNYYKIVFMGVGVLFTHDSAPVFANEFCVKSIEFEAPKNLDRETDIRLKPTMLVVPKNGGTPVFYNDSTQQDGYGYRVGSGNYGPRQVTRYVFWGLNKKGNFFGPFDLKQDSYRGLQKSRGRTKVVHDPVSGSSYFESLIEGEQARTTGTGRLYRRLVEIRRNAPPKVWSAKDFFNDESHGLRDVNWEEDFQAPVLWVGRRKMIIRDRNFEPMPVHETRESNVFYATLSVNFEGAHYSMKSNRVNSVVLKKGDLLPPVKKGTIVKEMRATADRGWYVGNVGRVYHDGLGGGFFTYTTVFQVKKTSAGLIMTAKKKFKPRTIFPFRSTGKCQVYSSVLKQVIFCSRGTYLKNGRQVKMKGVKPPIDMTYLGDDIQSQTALFQASGQLYKFDGEYLKKMYSPKFKFASMKRTKKSNRQFIALDKKLYEFKNGKLSEIPGLPEKTYGILANLVDAGRHVLLVRGDGIFNIVEGEDAKKIWEPAVGDYINYSSSKFPPTYVPYLDSVLFRTFIKKEKSKQVNFKEITDFHLIKSCEKG